MTLKQTVREVLRHGGVLAWWGLMSLAMGVTAVLLFVGGLSLVRAAIEGTAWPLQVFVLLAVYVSLRIWSEGEDD